MIECYFDGSCEPINPGGKMGFGFIILEDKKIINEWGDYVAEHLENSNNVAEYAALEMLLNKLVELGLNDEEILIKGDSNLVINQMMRKWKVKKGMYVKTAIRCGQLLPKFRSLKLEWIPRELNYLADNLSKL